MSVDELREVDGRPMVSDPEMEHYVCCYHEHVTYCGLTDTAGAVGWADDDDIDCVVCLDLAQVDDDMDGMFCPAEPYCRFVTGEGPAIPDE